MKTNLLILLFALLGFVAFAQPPQAINYQGVARDSMGHPLVNKNISLQLSILDSSATGQAIYVETHLTLTSSSGLFNIYIGNGNVIVGDFSTVPWGQGSKWLKVEMDVTGGSSFQLIGASQFMSVPYALYSKNGISGNANAGDMIYYNGTSWVSVSGGNYGQSLSYCNGVPTWGGCLPILSTSPISNIDVYMATGGGYIINDGGAPIASRGLCWSINSGPTITLSTITNDGSGTGVYTSNLTGLMPNTTYYVRAYATNIVGTAYGNEISFTSTTFTYLPNVTICSQIWMTQNLSASTYRNGDSIPNITNPTIWAGLTTGAWCWYNNDSATYAATFGKLYNWYAVSDLRGIAPVGWHVPNDSEWNRMIKCIDPFSDTICSNCSKSSIAGGALKETGLSHWISPNYGATNSTGFSAIPSGFFLSFFTNIGMDSYMWSSSEVNSTLSKTFNINSVSSDLYSSSQIKQYGFSVRCIRD